MTMTSPSSEGVDPALKAQIDEMTEIGLGGGG